MKKLFTIIIIASFAITMQAQDIINTLGLNGSFLVNKNDGTNYLKVDPSGKLNLGAGMQVAYTNGTSITLNDSHYFYGASANSTVTLPKITAANKGRVYIIKNIGITDCTVKTAIGDQIDTLASDDPGLTLGSDDSITVISDGGPGSPGFWNIVSYYDKP